VFFFFFFFFFLVFPFVGQLNPPLRADSMDLSLIAGHSLSGISGSVSLLPDDVVDAADAIRARLLRAQQQPQHHLQQQIQHPFGQHSQQQQQLQQQQQQQQQDLALHHQLAASAHHPHHLLNESLSLLHPHQLDQSSHARQLSALKQPSPPLHALDQRPDQRRTSEQLLMAAISLDYEESSTTTRAPPARNRPTTTTLPPRTLPKRKRAGQHRDFENVVDGADYDEDNDATDANDAVASTAIGGGGGGGGGDAGHGLPRRRGRPRRDAIKEEDEEYRENDDFEVENDDNDDNDDNNGGVRRQRPPLGSSSATAAAAAAAAAATSSTRLLNDLGGSMPPSLPSVVPSVPTGMMIDIKSDEVALGVRQMLTQLMPSLYTGVAGNTPQQVNFRLVKQPNELQRKSYANENRYVHPAPITVEYCGPHRRRCSAAWLACDWPRRRAR
jgi:hypothetical protein